MYSCIDNKTLNETDLENFRFLLFIKTHYLQALISILKIELCHNKKNVTL